MGITDVLLGIIIEDAVRLDPQKVGSNRSNSVKEELEDSKGLFWIEEQTTQWPKKDKQRSKEHIHKTKGRVTWTPLKLGVNSGAPEGEAVPTKYAFVCEKHNYQYLILVPLILYVIEIVLVILVEYN